MSDDAPELVVDPWMAAIFDADTDEVESLLSPAVAHLDELLEGRHDLVGPVAAVLDRRLGGPIGPETWDDTAEALASLVGWDVAHLVSWVAEADSDTRLALAATVGTPATDWFLREVTGRFGRELRMSIQRRLELPDDWHSARMEVFEDMLVGAHRVRATIEKMNGSTVELEGWPDSFLALLSNVSDALATLDARAFSEHVVDQARGRLEALVDLLREPPAEDGHAG